MHDRNIVRHHTRIGRRLRAARFRRKLGIGLLVTHVAGRTKREQRTNCAVDLMRVHYVARYKSSAGTTTIDVVDLSTGHQVVEGITIQRFTDLKADEFLSLRHQRVLDGKLRNVRNRDLVAPLLGNRTDLSDGHCLANRRHTFGKRAIWKWYAIVPRCGVGRAATLRECQRIAKLVGHQLPTRQRQRFVGNKIFNIGRKLGGCIGRGHRRLAPLTARGALA